MKVLKKLFTVTAIILVLLLGCAFLLPSTYHVERSVIINAPADKVYSQIGDMRNWPKWDPWTKSDPLLHYVYPTHKTHGKDARQKWKSGIVGNGEMIFTSVKPNEEVKYLMRSVDNDMDADGEFALDEGSGTKVYWRMQGNLGWNPLHRYMGLFMDGTLGKDFEDGLKNLQEVCEKQ